MGKLKGIVQFTGSFNGLSFYELNGKIVVRKTGGFDGDKIKKNTNYERVRENSSEFAHSARAGKNFRTAIASCLLPLRIPYVHNHIVRLFQGILKLDEVHARGKRTIHTGLLTTAGKKALLDFEFDTTQTFSSFFPFKLELDFMVGALNVLNFCAKQIKAPKAAQQVRLQLHVVTLDFEHFTVPIQNSSDTVLVDLQNGNEADLTFAFTPTIMNSCIHIAVLEVCFLQEVNGTSMRLKGGGIKIVGLHNELFL